jgi:hypothetical protein
MSSRWREPIEMGLLTVMLVAPILLSFVLPPAAFVAVAVTVYLLLLTGPLLALSGWVARVITRADRRTT